MKTTFKSRLLVATMLLFGSTAFAQLQPELQYFRTPGQDGLNVFETKKANDVAFEGLKVRVGGDFAIQFQGLSHSNDMDNLTKIGGNVNLPTANLNLDAQLADGVRVHLRTYLSSRHHNEAWVKGGYLQVDNLDFIKEDFLGGVMDIVTLRAGVDQINYGDAQFRRSDNAMAIYNPFVGNYIMDSFTTEPFVEVNAQPGDVIAVFGLSSGQLNPTVVQKVDGNGDVIDYKTTIYGKLGWDSQIDEDLRVRITGSFYNAPGYANGDHLYSGDRAGARYYNVLDAADASANFRSGRFNPGFKNETAFQINPFVKFKGLEFFGIFEQTSGKRSDVDTDKKGSYTQLGAELLYRFGGREQLYVAGRFNSVSGNAQYDENADKPDAEKINRVNFGAGWFITANTLMKLEYVNQTYGGAYQQDGPTYTSTLSGAKFNGVVMEAVISF